MAVPTQLSDLSATAASNSPAGTDTVGTTMDDFLRAHASIIARISAGTDQLATPSTGTQTVSGNIVFSGNARRIKGDFSNATFANRVAFQSSDDAQPTKVSLLPGASADETSIQMWSNADTTDAERTYLQLDRSLKIASVNLESVGTGSLTGWQMAFGINGNQHVYLTTANNALNLTYGQIAFPASQNASSNANTLDDYEEGTWTPALTFSTAGDLSVAYTTQVASYTKIGNTVKVSFNIETSSFTHTTASGNLTISGLPFAAANVTGLRHYGSLIFNGITKASYTQIAPYAEANTSTVLFQASGSGQAISQVAAADIPTGGNVILRGVIEYQTA